VEELESRSQTDSLPSLHSLHRLVILLETTRFRLLSRYGCPLALVSGFTCRSRGAVLVVVCKREICDNNARDMRNYQATCERK
jgi:hypothetical protein